MSLSSSHSPLAQAQWRILRNHEGRYSVHPAALETPPGWEALGPPDTRAACLEKIAHLWSDMRPSALQAAMTQVEAS